MDAKRNCRKIKCARCGRNILFSRMDIYENDNQEGYVDCDHCGTVNKLKKMK